MKTVKLSGENVGGKLHGIKFGNDSLDITPKAQATKEKINYSSSKLKILCIKQHYQQSAKATHRMGENIYKSHFDIQKV